MKITTRIVSGYGLFIAALVGLALYQIVIVHRMQEINQNLKNINAQNVLISLQTIQDVDLIGEFAEKALLRADPEYFGQLEEYIEYFDGDLELLQSGVETDGEREAVQLLKQYRDLFTANLNSIRENLPEEGMPELPESLQNDQIVWRNQAGSVYTAVMRSMAAKLDESAATSRTAQFVLISITVVVLSITILVSLLIVRSIAKPLSSLTEGTRAITEGKYFYRLDTSRNDEFAQLAKDFNTMIRRLNELDELKKDFISHVSHELKAPLASMRETVQLLIDEIPGPLTEKQKRLLELNLQSGDRLTAMIRNLLDLSKIEAGTVEYELRKQDIIPLVQTAVDEFEVRTKERQIRIETDLPGTPLEIRCDSDRIVQVIVNLVGNAVKFSPIGGIVRISLRPVKDIPDTMPQVWRDSVAVPEDGDYFSLLEIEDSGPGIADADKDRIFEKFHQVQKGKKVEGQGVGLGLAICRTIVQAHLGAVWVEDNPAGGSRFFLLLGSGKENEVALRASQPI